MDTKKTDKILFGENYGVVVRSDYAIVLGAAPEYAKLRAQIAANFYKKGGTAQLIASGAAVSDKNMTCALTEICKHADIMKVERITVITEPFHMKRALCLAKILLPSFIRIYGYTEGCERQRELWKNDERLKNCVENEVKILKQLVEQGRIEDLGL